MRRAEERRFAASATRVAANGGNPNPFAAEDAVAPPSTNVRYRSIFRH
jgi:hypothetical protein